MNEIQGSDNTQPELSTTEATSEPRLNLRKRLWQFGIRGLVVLLLLSAVVFYFVSRNYRESKIVERIESLGGKVLFDYQFKDGQFNGDGKPPGPTWVASWLGCDRNLFANVTSVKVVGSLVNDDIAWLHELKQLESLVLYNCDELVNLDFCERLSSLTYLDIGFCDNLADISMLAKAYRMKHLDLFGCKSIDDFTAIGELDDLEYVDISQCVGLKQIDFLSGLSNLKVVKATLSPLTRVNQLRDLDQLIELHLNDSANLADIKELASLKDLHLLNIAGCPNVVPEHTKLIREMNPTIKMVENY